MPRQKKQLTRLEQARQAFLKDHYISLIMTGECEFGDHTDVECFCGYKNTRYGSTQDVVNHVLEVFFGEEAIEFSTV